jgi:hypothetical protein
MASTVNYEVFGKRHGSCQHLFGTYANKTSKLGWYEKFDKKVHLASGSIAKGGQAKFLYKTCIGITPDETLELAEQLGYVSRTSGVSNNICISEGVDYKGDVTKLVLRDSDFQGLVLLRMNANKPDIVVEEPDDSDLDPEPVDTIDIEDDEVEWYDCFEKFYISKRDDWKKIQKVLLAIHADVVHLNAVDKESYIPPTSTVPQPPATTLTQKQVGEPVTTSTTTKGGGKRAAADVIKSGSSRSKKGRPAAGSNPDIFKSDQVKRRVKFNVPDDYGEQLLFD